MATWADIFRDIYRSRSKDVDFSSVRVHYTGADSVCCSLRAKAFTVGSDIYFATGDFRPHTRQGLWLLAHEVAHVVQQAHSHIDALPVTACLPVAPPGSAGELEADAAATAVLAGRHFVFETVPSRVVASCRPVVQRYMAWEHCLLGDLGLGRVDEQCTVIEDLGCNPQDVDEGRLRAAHPGLETVRLPGSGLVVTLGELNVLPDYLGHPSQIESAPTALLEPLLQSVRDWSITELRRSTGRPVRHRRLQGSLSYPRCPRLAEIREVTQVDALGRRRGLAPWDLYSAVLGRNAGHFAPFSWYRWQSFHLMARELIAQASQGAREERESLRLRARIYAGYADHFLQDSYAAGHLINKTLLMQWYIEWLADHRIRYPDRRWLVAMTVASQPFLHGSQFYDRVPVGPPWDPQGTVGALTLEARVSASGVIGDTQQERLDAYLAYLAMLRSTVAQIAVSTVHGYLNERLLVVSATLGGPRFRLPGDRTLLTGSDGAIPAAEAAALSRRAISELLRDGETAITATEIFAGFPRHVVQDGALVSLKEWHESGLRDLCFGTLFGQWRTRATRIAATMVSRRLGVPALDVELLQNGRLAGWLTVLNESAIRWLSRARRPPRHRHRALCSRQDRSPRARL